jgi:hypothetical protein
MTNSQTSNNELDNELDDILFEITAFANQEAIDRSKQQLSNLIKEIVNTKIYDETLHGEMEVVGFSIDRLRETQRGKATNLGFNIGEDK